MSASLDKNDDALRPQTLAEFQGQDRLARNLQIILAGARTRGQVPDHILFAGPPGLGKTTLAAIVASEMDLPFVATAAPAITKPAELIGLLNGLRGPSVVFIDEIHAMDRALEELLYSAMEDGHLDIVLGKDATARPIRLPIKPFTLIGATTQAGRLSGPLRDRFGFIGRLALYETGALAGIVARSASKLDIGIDNDAAEDIAVRACGTPRLANNLLRRVRDYAQFIGSDQITKEVCADAMLEFGIDELGLDKVARDILQAVAVTFNGGPVGGKTIAVAVGETVSTVEDMYEPVLLRLGLLARTPRGRTATPATYQHLGLPAPDAPTQATLPLVEEL